LARAVVFQQPANARAVARKSLRAAQRRAVLAWVALVVSGCAGLPPIAPATVVHTGRFSLQTRSGEHKDSASGRFSLAVRADSMTLNLETPLGTTLARIDSGADGATLRATGDDGHVREVRGPDAEALTENVLGWRLPLSGLGDWIVGRPASGRPAHVSDDDGATQIEQSGWTIRVLERMDANDAASPPRRLNFERPESDRAPRLTLRLVLDQPSERDPKRY
jgi:outer membrane lipoprotein LolB